MIHVLHVSEFGLDLFEVENYTHPVGNLLEILRRGGWKSDKQGNISAVHKLYLRWLTSSSIIFYFVPYWANYFYALVF